MSDTTLVDSTTKTDAEYELEFQLLMQEINHIEKMMLSDRADIDRLRAESSVITAHTDVILDQLEAQLNRLQRKI